VPKKSLLLVFSNPTEGREQEFNSWYDSTHVPDVLAVPGVVSAQRYEVAPVEAPEVEGAPPPPPPPTHRYLAVYELDRDGDVVMAEFASRIANGEMKLSDTLDFASVGLSVWRPRNSA
jgi:hypothetical protein